MIPILLLLIVVGFVDPLGRYSHGRVGTIFFRTCRPSVPTFQNLAKQYDVKTMFAIGETVGLAEWIIDDTFLVPFYFGTKGQRLATIL